MERPCTSASRTRAPGSGGWPTSTWFDWAVGRSGLYFATYENTGNFAGSIFTTATFTINFRAFDSDEVEPLIQRVGPYYHYFLAVIDL